MIKLKNVSKYYHNQGNVVLGLHKVNLEFSLGEFVAITGESGSGKSTLLNVISGVDTYEDGELYFNGEETSHYDSTDWEEYRKKYVGFVFQAYNLIDSYTVLENVETALVIRGFNREERRKRSLEILESVGLGKHIKNRGTELSGGEKQRLSIARAIAKDAPVIVADEPTGNLDSKTSKQILDLLKELAKTKLVIVVTHNENLIQPYVTRFVRIYDGEITQDKRVKQPEIANEFTLKSRNSSLVKRTVPFAFWNIKNKPKTSFLSFFVVFLLTIIISFITAGFASSRVDFSSAHNQFFKIREDRIIVKKKDNTAINPTDVNKIESLNNVSLVIAQDLAINSNGLLFPDKEESEFDFYQYSVGFRHIDEFKNLKLIAGRMPHSRDEIIISSNEEDFTNYLDKEMTIQAANRYPYFSRKVTIVGITSGISKYRFGIDCLLTDELLTEMDNTLYLYAKNPTIDIYSSDDNKLLTANNKYILESDPRLKNDEIIIKRNDNFTDAPGLDKDSIRGKRISFTLNNELMTFKVTNFESYHKSYLVFNVSPEIYNNLITDVQYQHSVIVKNINQVDRTIASLEQMGFDAFLPHDGEEFANLFVAIMNVFRILLYFGIVFTIYLISFVILRTILAAKGRDYAVFSSIGLDSKAINMTNMFEITFHFVLAILIVLPVVIILKHQVEIFSEIYATLYWYHYLLLFSINLVFGIFLANRFNKYMQKQNLQSMVKDK